MKLTRHEAAIRLDISPEMARRHELPARISEAELAELDSNPPPWLVQSRANRTGKRPVWVTLTCVVCGKTEEARPKKWWPEFTYLSCTEHYDDELPAVAQGLRRHEVAGIGAGFYGVIDEKLIEFSDSEEF